MTLSVIFSLIAITGTVSICYAERDNEENKLSERDVAVLCGASEDYEENKEQCDKLYHRFKEGIIENDQDFE